MCIVCFRTTNSIYTLGIILLVVGVILIVVFIVIIILICVGVIGKKDDEPIPIRRNRTSPEPNMVIAID